MGWYRQTLQPIWSTIKECVKMHISNDKWLITSSRIYYKNSSASLDCISISESCSAINSTIATVHENFTSQPYIEALSLVRCNIWNSLHETNGKYENLNSMKSHLHYYYTTYYRCSYVANSVHEYFEVTDYTCKSHNFKQVWNNKTSQNHITASPHCYHKTFCSYSYIIVVHFTASTIWGLQKLGLTGMVGYHCRFLILKCSLVSPNLNEVVSVGSSLIWTVVICPNIYNISRMQIWKKLFKFSQMVPIVPKFEWSCFNYPNVIEAVGICPNACNCM